MSSAVICPDASPALIDNAIEEISLALLQLHDLLDGAGGNQPVDHDHLGLTDPVGAVDRLSLRQRDSTTGWDEDIVGLGRRRPTPPALE